MLTEVNFYNMTPLYDEVFDELRFPGTNDIDKHAEVGPEAITVDLGVSLRSLTAEPSDYHDSTSAEDVTVNSSPENPDISQISPPDIFLLSPSNSDYESSFESELEEELLGGLDFMPCVHDLWLSPKNSNKAEGSGVILPPRKCGWFEADCIKKQRYACSSIV